MKAVMPARIRDASCARDWPNTSVRNSICGQSASRIPNRRHDCRAVKRTLGITCERRGSPEQRDVRQVHALVRHPWLFILVFNVAIHNLPPIDCKEQDVAAVTDDGQQRRSG